MCGDAVPHIYRPGRGRIYCTNACRQRAYRWRRAHGVKLCVERNGPTERSVNHRRHALRDRRDPVSRINDRRGREVTVCGVFATPVRDTKVTYDEFVPEHEWACDSCSSLIGAGPFGTGIPDVVRPYWDLTELGRWPTRRRSWP
jgi:hypothetical protein